MEDASLDEIFALLNAFSKFPYELWERDASDRPWEFIDYFSSIKEIAQYGKVWGKRGFSVANLHRLARNEYKNKKPVLIKIAQRSQEGSRVGRNISIHERMRMLQTSGVSKAVRKLKKAIVRYEEEIRFSQEGRDLEKKYAEGKKKRISDVFSDESESE